MTTMNDLTADAMIGVSEQWLSPGPVRTLLESKELTRVVLAKVKEAHEPLVLAQEQDGEVKQRVKAMMKELAELDAQHDRLARGVYRGLEVAADLSESSGEAEPFLDARDHLFPNALSINGYSYLEETGNARKVAERISVEIRKTLGRVTVDGKPLDHFLDEWVNVAQDMGKLIAERAMVSGDEDDTEVTAGDLRQLRRNWIRAAQGLLTNVDLADFSDEARRKILAVLNKALDDAAKRNVTRATTKVEEEPVS